MEQTILSVGDLEFTANVAGSSADPAVILVHGFPDTPSTFRHQIDPLAAAGYRVIAPVLRGYEPTSQPADDDYSLMTLAGDVVTWLDALEVDRAHVVGHDWGAAITHVASARWPERFLTATTIAVPPVGRIPAAVRRVPKQLLLSWYMTFFQLPVAERAVVAKDWGLMKRLWSAWSPGYTMSEDEWLELRSTLAKPGVLTAALSYYRQNATPPILLGLRSTEAMDLIDVAVPTLMINGADDGCMDSKLIDHATKTSDFSAGHRRLEVPDAGHFVHLEAPEAVNVAIIEHLGNARQQRPELH